VPTSKGGLSLSHGREEKGNTPGKSQTLNSEWKRRRWIQYVGNGNQQRKGKEGEEDPRAKEEKTIWLGKLPGEMCKLIARSGSPKKICQGGNWGNGGKGRKKRKKIEWWGKNQRDHLVLVMFKRDRGARRPGDLDLKR